MLGTAHLACPSYLQEIKHCTCELHIQQKKMYTAVCSQSLPTSLGRADHLEKDTTSVGI